MRYEPHIFLSLSVEDVRDYLEEATAEDYPVLCAIDDDALDQLLGYCCRKGLTFFEADGSGFDLDELERIAENYFKK